MRFIHLTDTVRTSMGVERGDLAIRVDTIVSYREVHDPVVYSTHIRTSDGYEYTVEQDHGTVTAMLHELEVTNAMVKMFQAAWEATPKGQPGDRTRAGLRAVLDADR